MGFSVVLDSVDFNCIYIKPISIIFQNILCYEEKRKPYRFEVNYTILIFFVSYPFKACITFMLAWNN